MHSFTVNNQDEKSEHIIEFDDENLEMFITESQPNPDEVILNSIIQDEPTIRLLNPFNAFPDEIYALLCKNAQQFLQIKLQESLSTTEIMTENLPKLNDEQKSVFNLINKCSEGISGTVHGCIVVGGPGTGKSLLIKHLMAFGQQNFINFPKKTDRLVCGSTGTAAYNISGVTIHSLLHLLNNRITGTTEKKIRSMLEGIKMIIIDEMSLISAQLLKMIDTRLKVILKGDALFGGLSLVLIGDFQQLPPVDGTPIFKDKFYFHSKYFMFALLKQCQRQKGDKEFMNVLDKLRTGKMDIVAFKYLQQQCFATQNNERMKQFLVDDDVPYLFATNREIELYNIRKLAEMTRVNIVKIECSENTINKKKGKTKQTQIGKKYLYLCGCKSSIDKESSC